MALLGFRHRRVVIATHWRKRATALAGQLQAALDEHGLRADAHLLASGCVALSVARGVLVRTDGEVIWWVTRKPRSHGRPRLSMYYTPGLAAERLLDHPAVVERLHGTDPAPSAA